MDNNEKFQKGQNDINYNIEPKVSLNPPNLTEIGKTIVSDRFPITMDNFWFALNSNVVANPFDFITVENLHNTRTIGIVKELQTIAIDSYSLLQPGVKEQQQQLLPPQTTTTT
ncbi:MAG: hypothetical protein M3222_05595, partial [Thermoproteota archaeon]|nr:hypothetical protein [Thermoproteota archaeon]